MSEVTYVAWSKPSCPKCSSIIKVHGSGRTSESSYTEYFCTCCGKLWMEEDRKPGFLVQVREMGYIYS